MGPGRSRTRHLLGVMLAATMLQGCQSLNVLAAIDGPYVPPGERAAQPASRAETAADLAVETVPAQQIAIEADPAGEAEPVIAAPVPTPLPTPAPAPAAAVVATPEPAAPEPAARARPEPVIVLTLEDADPALARSLAREEAAQIAAAPEIAPEIAPQAELLPEPEPEPEPVPAPAATPEVAIAAVVPEPVGAEPDAELIGPPPPENPREDEFASAFDFIADDSAEPGRTEREGVMLAEAPVEEEAEQTLAVQEDPQLASAAIVNLPPPATATPNPDPVPEPLLPERVEQEPAPAALAVAVPVAAPAPAPAAITPAIAPAPRPATRPTPTPPPSSQLERAAETLGLSVVTSMPSPASSPFDLAPGTGSEAYQPFFDHVMAKLTAQPNGGGRESMLLLDPPSLDPALQICGNRPPAVLIDLDPANGLMPLVGQNRPNDSLAAQLANLRQRGVTIYWISGHGPGQASAIRRRLADSGLDPDGVDPLIVTRFAGESKQERRYGLGDSNCLLAIMGDQRADFDELYDFVLDPIMAAPLEGLIGEGWFLAPPPLD
ncbi:hypothetical protein GCM10009127_07980 [Alteraurantiacibacter aestuarii]|uniref:Uncharacterized protein n=1 Tax=Alteraurantiacibacter aestuarii TaxID=650004 RepID=A0A844ZF84_9SPHN|nr:hypothetical protein [Alteraurantiacibacter aestuarii]MXO87191.1 hypothetical protein [Alteraurantiacibacter aestuarii]